MADAEGRTPRTSAAPHGRYLVAAAAVLVSLVLVSILASIQIAADRQTASRRAAMSAAQSVATDLAVEIQARAAAVGEIAISAARAQSPEAAAGVVGAQGRNFPLGITILTDADAEASVVVRTALDQGVPVASAPFDTPDGIRVHVAAPLYFDGEVSLTSVPPLSTGLRRSLGYGAVVGVIDPAPNARLGMPIASPSRDGGEAMSVVVMGHTFHVWAPTAAADWPVELAVLGVALGLASSFAVLRIGRASRSIEDERDDRARQMELIAEIGPVVQRSLDLGDVFPIAAAMLADEFDFADVAFSIRSDDGSMREVFTTANDRHRDRHADGEVLVVPARLDSGEHLRLSMQRDGRAVGVVAVTSSRPLDAIELATVQLVTELTTAAVVNAQLFTAQQEAVSRLRDVDQLKTVFLGTASHELRTPVTALIGFSGLLNEKWDAFDDDTRKQFVGRIASNAAALEALIAQLLDFSKVEAGTMAVSVEPLDVSLHVADILDRLDALFDDHTLVADIEPGLVVDGDRATVDRIVSNLVSNAAKFSPHGTTITVSLRTIGETVQLRVDDEGPGVPLDEREKVFSRFFHGGDSAVTKTRGAGIGLSVVAELASAMDAPITIGSSPSGGARFTVTFTRSNAPKEPEHATSS